MSALDPATGGALVSRRRPLHPVPAELPPVSSEPGHVRRPVLSFAVCVVLCALGLLAISVADALSRHSQGGANWLFWAGMVLLIAPVAIRLIRVDISREERLGLLATTALALYGAKVLRATTAFQFHDEFAHWRNAANALQTGHLFGFNPLIPTTAYYPGLTDVTVAIARTSGLSIFVSGLLVIAAARLLLIAGLFLLLERLIGSRSAGIASLIYFSNPNFLYWSAQFAYESLALPLAVFALYCAHRAGDVIEENSSATAGMPWFPRMRAAAFYRGAASAAILAVVVTHHIASYALTATLLAWTAFAWWQRRVRPCPLYAPAGLALLSLGGTAVWLFAVAPHTLSYLGPVLNRAVGGATGLLLHQQTTRQLFVSGGQVAPTWERLVALAAVALLIVGLPFAVVLLRRRRPSPLTVVLALGALLYVALLPLRLVATGQETANRSSEYVFIGLGILDAVLLVELVLARVRSFLGALTSLLFLILVFIGGVAVSWAYYDRLAPDIAARGSPSSVTPASVAVAGWMHMQLGPGNRVATDIENALALGSYGFQHPLSGATDGAQIWKVFVPATINAGVRAEMRADHVAYIVADHRLTKGLPPFGGAYFDVGEPNAGRWTHPLPRTSFKKFSRAVGINRLYDSGRLQVYGVTRVAGGALP